jgi:hypothetical protein
MRSNGEWLTGRAEVKVRTILIYHFTLLVGSVRYLHFHASELPETSTMRDLSDMLTSEFKVSIACRAVNQLQFKLASGETIREVEACQLARGSA